MEKAYGARFRNPPTVVSLSTPAAEAVFAEDMRPEFERRYPQLPPKQRENLLRLGAGTSVRSCVARFSFASRAIVVVRDGFDAQCKALGVEGERAEALLLVSLAHEAVHALDDQRLDLAAIYREAPDDEALRARAMIAEGRAVHWGRQAATAAGAPADLVALLPGGDSPRGEREWTLHLTYRLGMEFAAAVAARGPEAADRALREPPALTWWVCRPDRWPDQKPDDRPRAALVHAGLGDAAQPLSELQLRARYAALHGLDTAAQLFDDFRGGSQALVDGTNAAVLAFATEDAAKRYEELSRAEAPTVRRGDVVARAAGAAQDAVLAKLAAALGEAPGSPR